MQKTELQECKEQLGFIQNQVEALSLRIQKLEFEEKGQVQGVCAQQNAASVRRNNVANMDQCGGFWEVRKPRSNASRRKEQNEARIKEIKNQFRHVEGQVGKNLFAVLASLLILIGVGIFIANIYESIPEAVKLCVIYLFGFGLLGSGLKLHQKKGNRFWLGVASCGAAELLVSIIASYTYFKVISLPITYLFVLVWVAGTFALTKVHASLFKIISYIGFVVSMMFGMSMLAITDGLVFVTLFGSFVGLAACFVLSHPQLVKVNLVFLYCNTFALMMFQTDHFYWNEASLLQSVPVDLSVFIIFAIIGFHVMHLFRFQDLKLSYSIYSCVTFYCMGIALEDILFDVFYAIMIFVSMVLWISNILKSGANKEGRVFAIFSIIFMAGINIDCLFESDLEGYFTTRLLLVVPILLFVYLYGKTNDHTSMVAALTYFVFFAISDYGQHSIVCVLVAMGIFCWIKAKDKYGEIYKNIWYVFGAVWLVYGFEFVGQQVIEANEWIVDYPRGLVRKTFESLAIFVLTALNLFRIRKEIISEKGYSRSINSVVLNIVNGFLFVYGVDILTSRLEYEIPIEVGLLVCNRWIIMFLLIVATFAILSSSVVHSIKSGWADQYLTMFHCIKFTVYFWIIVGIFTDDAIGISVLLLMLAIASIMVGFKLRSKAARFYGLALSLLCTVSLVLSSISFHSSMQVAGGVILCGVLCFVISFIYSKASKLLGEAAGGGFDADHV